MFTAVFDSLQKARDKRRAEKMRQCERKDLPSSFPELANIHPQLTQIEQEYRPLHDTYIKVISDRLNAVSLRQAALLAWMVRERPVQRILDTGSGFSSMVLRAEAQSKPGVAHFAVEDNTFWLNRTTEFLREQKLPAENVLSWDEFKSNKALSCFDLVFHDMGNMTTRITSLLEIESRVTPEAWLILDDMHKGSYYPHALRTLGDRWMTQSLVDLTLDDSGRYACICRRKF
jgi:predicted O-methyltransferase YrrM